MRCFFGLVAGIAGNGEAGEDDAGERQPAFDDDGLVQCFHFICPLWSDDLLAHPLAKLARRVVTPVH